MLLTGALAVLILSPDTAHSFTDIVLIGAAIAAVATFVKVFWHPRSPLRRSIMWVFRKSVSDPVSRAATRWLEAFIIRIVTPQLEAIRVQLVELAEVNDQQHLGNAGRIDGLTTQVVETNARLAETNGQLAKTSGIITAHLLLDPPLPDAHGNTVEL